MKMRIGVTIHYNGWYSGRNTLHITNFSCTKNFRHEGERLEYYFMNINSVNLGEKITFERLNDWKKTYIDIIDTY